MWKSVISQHWAWENNYLIRFCQYNQLLRIRTLKEVLHENCEQVFPKCQLGIYFFWKRATTNFRISNIKVGTQKLVTLKNTGILRQNETAAQKITPVVITYLPIRSNFGVVRKVVKISIFRFSGESTCTENTRRSIECITKCLQNLQQKKVFECIHVVAYCMLGKSKAIGYPRPLFEKRNCSNFKSRHF